MKIRLVDQIFRRRRGEALPEQVRINQRLIEGHATHGDADDEKYPK